MNTSKTYSFQSESKELLKLMIHSLYSNKEIFIRELISNASDAIDKLRFLSISEPKKYPINTNYCINITIDKKLNKLTISDNGIGMEEHEIINNLGTIAKSGTKKFIQSLKSNNSSHQHELIGQFGVGFYSSFIVSKKVLVQTRSAKLKINEGFLWESYGKGDYTIQKIEKKEFGTDIILYFKKTEQEFIHHWKIQELINKYSDHINVPINIKKFNKKQNEYTWEQVNKAQALWVLNKSEISNQEYINFYKHLTKDSQEPLTWTHNKVEGNQEYIILLFIPSKTPWNIWSREHKHGLKLYINKVFIMEDTEQFLPNYLRFVKGLVDSNDLPLNISREILQNNQIIQKIRQTITKKLLNTLQNLFNNDIKKYYVFWQQFGTILKEGPAEDPQNRQFIMNLLLFTSLKHNNSEQTLSLKKYTTNMAKGQNKIYYITSDSYESAKNSPHLEIFLKNDIDVLLLFEKIDEWMMNYLNEYEDKKFCPANKPDDFINKLIIPQINEQNLQNKMQPFLEKIKKILGNKIKDVRVTYKLVHTPSILVTEAKEMSTQMAKLFSAAGQSVPSIKYILEINPEHALIQKISKIVEEKNIKDWILLIFEQALFVEKGTLDDPNQFINRINKLLSI
ncbi:heat shock protein 90 [Buchnera aphidicola (Nipponaphis monzeni)]|uniref:Chaperone protein HtpG n=1 Tax=Buchnera aphidicola (Nipponaphis monzeni) TaxID=2495405 RepID=A0A455TAL0_9GAMM|nr:molecular chaperone HtpG [Buchnera aphidicola]BBI01366.1 heat shock protein 90 [Buchnera aphidicola (Nipponaphis monzeni)]